MNKKCIKCNIEKPITDFYKDSSTKDNYRPECKSCKRQLGKLRYLQNRERINEQCRQYYRDNKEAHSERCIQYYQKNKQTIHKYMNQYQKTRRATDSLYSLICKIRNLIGKSHRNQKYSKKSKTFKILGCEGWFLQVHLEYTFELNYGVPYTGQAVHIDHIIPISSATSEDELLKLNHWTNLQYLTPEDNLKKSDSLVQYPIV